MNLHKNIAKSIQFVADVIGISRSKVEFVGEGISKLPVIVQAEEVVVVVPPPPPPAPTITTITFLPLSTSETKNIVITGTNFTASTTVTISKGANSIVVNTVTFDSATQLTVNITTALITGGFDVTVNNGTAVTAIDGITVAAGVTVLTPGDGTTAWIDVNGTVTTSLRKIVPSTAGTGWNKSGSFGNLPASTDGFLSFNSVYMSGYSSGGYAMCGLAVATSGGSYTNIDFAIYPYNGTKVEIYESGARVYTQNTPYNLSDVFTVERIGTTIYYKKNGTTFRTKMGVTTGVLYAKAAIWGYAGFENLKIEY